MVMEELHSEEQDDSPGKKDLLGHIQGAVTNETQAWGSVMEEGALRCTSADGKVTRGRVKTCSTMIPTPGVILISRE